MSMIIDQAEIDALLQQAGVMNAPEAPTPPPPPPKQRMVAPVAPGRPLSRVERIMRIRVPIIVRLASRRQTVSEIRRFSVGMMIEFERNVNDHLDLLVNNRCIGIGEAVKTSEHFGLRVSQITTIAERVASLGK
ncbi:MAG: FliM/FliN family flagellar motor switch protein [Phycisphaerae bacterium]